VQFFHYCDLRLSNYLLLIYCRVCSNVWRRDPRRSRGPWSAEYLESTEKQRIHRRNLNN